MKFLAVLMAFLLSSPAVFCTTLCWDGKTLACDNQTTSGHTKFKSAGPKIVRSDKRHASIGTAGDVSITAPIKKFFLTSDKPLSEYPLPDNAKTPDANWAMVIIYDDGTAEVYLHTMLDPAPINAPFAIGTGQDFAMAILVNGGDARHAIEITEALDLYTGGTIHVLEAPQAAKSKK